MSRVMRAAHLVVDVDDLDRAAGFWAALLDLGVAQRDTDWVDLAPLGGGGPVLSFQLVPERKIVKNRLHLDVAVDPTNGGVVAAGFRAQALGATPASELFSPADAPWQVWRDPAGNEFCLVTETAGRPTDSVAADSVAADARCAH